MKDGNITTINSLHRGPSSNYLAYLQSHHRDHKGDKEMNDFINAQTQQMKAYVKAWEAACELASKKTDGKMDREEAKALKHIHKAVERFTRDLERF